ncbi:hypothetical protein [Aeromicrobium sp.]|uniref:hypothetical protein n=1 Tax=Aeromicrobium sp. TaxID=1871063 RepID=UPI0030BAA642
MRDLPEPVWTRFVRDRAVLSVLVVLLVALAVMVALLVRGGDAADSTDQAAAEAAALKAARTSAVSMTSYDYRRLDTDFAWADDAATESFARQYRDANKPLRGVITKLKATARGSVVASAATAKGPRKVQVVMFIDQRVTNRADGDKRSDKSRVVMSMVERDGRWLVDDVDLR